MSAVLSSEIRDFRKGLDSTETLIAAIRNGEMVILLDDEDRENEGDLIMAAEHITPQAINFMVTYGRGLVCMPITKERCDYLKLPLMVSENTNRFGTNFTVSIEAAKDVTTGISAFDRSKTIKAAANPHAVPEDLVQPGHIFPLMAETDGVLKRAGHTEAVCDLVRLAGYTPIGVLVEILNDDGTMARRPDCERFAVKHGLKIGTIADLIQYRLKVENDATRSDRR